MRPLPTLVCGLVLANCLMSCVDSSPPPDASPIDASITVNAADAVRRSRTVRLSGTLEAVRSTRVVVPQLSGPFRSMTLTRLVPNGRQVEAGDIVAEFDPIEQIDFARQSAAQFEDLSYQVRQKKADNAAALERRLSAIRQAEADLAKALLEVSKAEVLSDVEAEQNAIRAEKAEAHLESLRRSHADEELVDQAALRILELRRDRERVNFENAQANLEKLQVRAPLSGMAALFTRYSSSSIVQPREGDQMSSRSTLMSIFDPGEMRVRASVAEPDGALLESGLEAMVYLDAYPDLAIPARFEGSSPIAAGGLGTPIRSFTATFRLEESDPRLMPDLSAAVVFEAREPEVVAAVEGRERP